jgi:hypothetical protein
VQVLVTRQQYEAEFASHVALGYRPDQINVLSTAVGPLFTVLWVAADATFETRHGLSSAELDARQSQMASAGFVAVDLTAYQDGGVRFVATWVRRPTAARWSA